jgi:hypothetical protein
LKVGLVGVDVAMVMRLPLARAWFQLGWECISGGVVLVYPALDSETDRNEVGRLFLPPNRVTARVRLRHRSAFHHPHS